MFTPMASYVPNFLFFGGKSSNDDDDGDSRVPPHSNLRRTKHKKSSQRYETPDLYLNRIEGAQEKTNRWYDSFFYGSTEENDATSTTSPTSTSSAESEGFFDWLNGGSNEVDTTESASAISAEHSNQSKLRTLDQRCVFYRLNEFRFADWFSGLFGTEKTTKAPPVTTTTMHSPLNALQSPDQWLSILASHMATTTTKPTRMKIETPKRVKYDDYQVWRVMPSTQAHVDFLREYKTGSDGEKIHWLKGPAMR